VNTTTKIGAKIKIIKNPANLHLEKRGVFPFFKGELKGFYIFFKHNSLLIFIQ